jgi:CDP-4-dehydro-6-deoxyglucose reductase
MSTSQEFEVEVEGAPIARAAFNGVTRVVARSGESLLAALTRAGAPILSVCGGQASCGACRLEIAAEWFGRLTPAGPTEAMLLEFLEDPHPHHRLACQLKAEPASSGVRLTLAA